jgi:nucleoside-diphosphate-sugar epimerase
VSALRLVVLGGSGFIGSRLVSRLVAEGHDVVIADKRPSAVHPARCVTCDVRDYDAVLRAVAGRDVIINLAAEHQDNVQPISLYDEVNVEGAKLVCRAATEAKIARIVFTSSVAIYGFATEELREESPARPFNDYGRTKLEAERVYDAWYGEQPGRTLVVMRPTVVFGEGNRGNVYNLIRQLASGFFVMIGDGKNRKSMAYVENVAACLSWTLGLPVGRHLFNYADKPDFDMNDLVRVVRQALGKSPRPPARLPLSVGLAGGRVFDAIAAITGKTLPISTVRVRKFTANTMISSERLRSMGFVAPVAIADGLTRTLAAEFSQRGGPTAA